MIPQFVWLMNKSEVVTASFTRAEIENTISSRYILVFKDQMNIDRQLISKKKRNKLMCKIKINSLIENFNFGYGI